MTAVLSTTGLTVFFGGVRALLDVDIEVQPGELLGLIGPNGAGKTTLIDAISGFVAHEGTVSLDGHDITNASPTLRARMGLARTWQAVELFDDLTVRENLTVAARHPSVGATLKELFTTSTSSPRPVEEALERFGVSDLADTTPSELTQGQRKLVAVARALAAQPKLLCLDEPAAGLDEHESAAFGAELRQIVDDGTPALLIDHDMGLVLGICDRVVVIEFGEVIATGTPTEIRADANVVAAYLGTGGAQSAASSQEHSGPSPRHEANAGHRGRVDPLALPAADDLGGEPALEVSDP